MEAGKPDHGMIQVPNADKTAMKWNELGISLKPSHRDILSTRNAHSIKVKKIQEEDQRKRQPNSPCRLPFFPQSRHACAAEQLLLAMPVHVTPETPS